MGWATARIAHRTQQGQPQGANDTADSEQISWQVGWGKKHGSGRERRKKLWRNKSKTPQLHYVFLIPVLNRATTVKSMTSPTIRTRSYQARPLDIVPSRACCGIQTTSVPHVKRSRTGATTRCYTTRPTATTKACAGSGGPSTTAARLGYTSAFVAGHRGHQQPPRRTNRGRASDSHELHPGATPT